MAEQDHKAKNIIIKRVKKVAAGAHGGSWKVAYADLVTAMMAFFLLMWLLNMVPQDKKEQLASYFNDFSIFQNPGPSAQLLDSGGLGPPGAVVGSQDERPDVAIDRDGKAPSGGKGQGTGDLDGGRQLDAKAAAEAQAAAKAEAAAEAQAVALEQQVEKALQESVPELAGQVSVTQEKDKVRIEIMDKSDRPLFDLGGVALLPDAQRILAAVTGVIRKDGIKVAIEGHTDAYRYSGTYSNWDLSAGRALSARRLMLQQGLPPDQVAAVSGFADTRPYVPGKPLDARNRRISLLLYREPKPGETPAGGKGGVGAAKPAPTPRTPDVGEVLEKQIDNLYDKSTDGQF
ncbi:OmpA/MotB domain protein [Solidesulfovibrio carbinoliphilus subsp. oakridgensis]|uniref:OmpA/MotB domain protein n=1 Tax=Solidesulfovibrio carbinoliphilus subsp. oakridgensis TaxID=694327 RepID=G7Q902_9BACT|nr:flagellar motor protein MotB [Solidesulfovibrio carbinoliphilus]EHJ47724.1 OmpA/MotB domain protein [Solidesulfovibrio carbinoliphilus subsp. oakridgensis]